MRQRSNRYDTCTTTHSKYLILNPESNLGVNRRSLPNQERHPSPRQIRALSLARFALARSLCTVLHLPASLTSRAALTCHSHSPAPSMCTSSPRASQMCRLSHRKTRTCTARVPHAPHCFHRTFDSQIHPPTIGFNATMGHCKNKAASTTWKRRGKTGRRRRPI